MKKTLIVLPLVILLGFFGAADLLFGASKKKAPPPPVVKAPTIVSVTATSITVSEEKTAKTLAITQFTEIIVNGQKATAADLKPGMTVNIGLGSDPTKASRINATGK